MKYITFVFCLLMYSTVWSQDPIVHYMFDGNGLDASGNGHHATLVTATPTTDRFSTPSSAYLFDGVNDVINLPLHSELKPDLPITISLWARFGSTNQMLGAIFTNEHRENFYSGFWVGLQSGRVHVSFGDGGDPGPFSRRTAISTLPITINTWYHIVAVIRGAGDMELYVTPFDNSSTDCVDETSTWTYQGSGGSMNYFGNPHRGVFGLTDQSDTPGVPISRFLGSIDDFKMWDYALTIEEINDDCTTAECDVTSNFSYTNLENCTKEFEDTSTSDSGDIIGWAWNFGDPASGSANTSSLQNPTHTFSGPGSYTVCLETTAELNGELCTDEHCASIFCVDQCSSAQNVIDNILNSLTPVDVVNMCGLYQVELNFPTSIFHNITIDWGDGISEPITFGTTTHQYPNDVTANYVVTITIMLDDGTVCASSSTTILVECGSCNCDLGPTISYLKQEEDLGCTVNLFASINEDPCYENITYTWYINGDNVWSGPEPFYTHTFDGSGTFEICLIVSTTIDGELCQDRVCITENVDCNSCDDECEIIPQMQITQIQNPNTQCSYELIGENLGSVCSSQEYSWFIYDSDGVLIEELSGETTLFNPLESGEYTVCLRIFVLNDQCEELCSEEVCKLLINQCDECLCRLSPSFDFTVDEKECVLKLTGDPGPYTCLSDITYFWYINGELVNSGTSPNYSYDFTESGEYEVCLEIEANNTVIKCEAKTCKDINLTCDKCDFDLDFQVEKLEKCTLIATGEASGPVLYEWTIYQGITNAVVGQQSGADIDYTFPGNGEYIICLTASLLDNEGNILCSKTICKEVQIKDCSTCKDECDLNPGIDISFENCQVILKGYNEGIDCPSHIFLWNVYDAETNELIGTYVNPEYTFTAENGNVYKICLTIYVINDEGKTKCKEQTCKTLGVRCNEELPKLLNTNNADSQFNTAIQVFPNPTTGKVTFSIQDNNVVLSENAIIEVYNQLGQKVFSKNFGTERKCNVNLDEINSGVLIYKISENGILKSSGKFVLTN